MNKLIKRITEPSSVRGLVGILTAFGVTIEPDRLSAYVAIYMIITGYINLVRDDNGRED